MLKIVRLLATFAAILCLITWPVGKNIGTVLNRPPHFDEVLTQLLVSESTPFSVIEGVSTGMVANTPGVELLLWPIVQITGAGVMQLRIASLIAAALGLLGLAILLNRHLGLLSAISGVVATASVHTFIDQSWLARFYPYWFMATMWTLVVVDSRMSFGRRGWTTWALAVLAAFTCLTHYFGIIGLGLAFAGSLLWADDRKRAMAAWLPAISGVIVLLPCVVLVKMQMAALQGANWIPALRLGRLLDLVSKFYGGLALGLTALLAAILAGSSRESGGSKETRALLPSLALAVFPVILVMLSLSSRNSSFLLDRYALPVSIAVGAAVASLSKRFPVWAHAVIWSVALVSSYNTTRAILEPQRGDSAAVAALSNAIANAPEDQLIVTVAAHDLFSIQSQVPTAANRMRVVSEMTETSDADLRRRERFEYYYNRATARRYPRMAVIDAAELPPAQSLLVVVRAGSLDTAQAVFAGREWKKLSNDATGIYLVGPLRPVH